MKNIWLLKANENSDDKYIECLNNAGFCTHQLFPLSFKFINNEVIKDALENPENHSGIVFTSPRAVKAISNNYKSISVSKHQIWKSKKIFAIGETTATAIKNELDFENPIGANTFTAKNLAPVIISETKEFDIPLLIPCGNQKREELPTLLVKENRDFRSIVCYETLPNPSLQNDMRKLLTEGKIPDFIIFFSPSGVKYSLPIFKNVDIDVNNTNIIAIGPTTNQSLVENEVKVSGISPSPSPSGLLHVIQGL